MHPGSAAIGRHFAYGTRLAKLIRHMLGEFGDDVAQPVRLELAGDVIGESARKLDVLEPVHHIEEVLRLRPTWMPQVGREDQRAAARIVVEDGLCRRIGEYSAVPVKLAVDADKAGTPAAMRMTP